MAVKIRLTRLGKKKKPFYRLVAASSSRARDGQCLEVLGFYDPTQSPVYLDLKQDRVNYWLSVGAQPTETAERLLVVQGLVKAVERKSAFAGIAKKDRKPKS